MFTPWGYSGSEMNLISTREDVLKTFFSENGEWTITATRASVDNNFLRFEFDLKRKPLFLVVNVLLPIVFMACINVLTFLLPAESGERISYAITCLLAIAVFLTLVSDNLPKTSQPMSIMCYYLMIILIVGTIICLATILNLKVFFADEKIPVPHWCKRFVWLMKCGCTKRKEAELNNIVHPFKKEENVIDEKPKAEPLANETGGSEITWRELSYAIDRLCILTFTTAIIVVTGVFIGILSTNNGKQ